MNPNPTLDPINVVLAILVVASVAVAGYGLVRTEATVDTTVQVCRDAVISDLRACMTTCSQRADVAFAACGGTP